LCDCGQKSIAREAFSMQRAAAATTDVEPLPISDATRKSEAHGSSLC